jgi:hypothetical protein
VTIAIPLTICARDEAQAIGACLDSLLASARLAEAALAIQIAPLIVLDDTTDATGELAAARGVPTRRSTGGKVEAQRAGLRPGPFNLFADADIAVAQVTLTALCRAMLESPALQVAVPAKHPLAPRRRWDPLARALHVYNARRGFSSQRTWFSGKLFAIRAWAMPTGDEVARRAAALPASRFAAYAEPLRVDDIYLSRAIVHAHGPGAIREVDGAALWFRAPETFGGMYRYYRRMRRELERTDALFPELAAAHREHGTRTAELAGATLAERAAYRTFQVALAACRAGYHLERFAVDHLGVPPGDPWPPIAETK